jgi:glutaminyl-peptide cyclotransferase
MKTQTVIVGACALLVVSACRAAPPPTATTPSTRTAAPLPSNTPPRATRSPVAPSPAPSATPAPTIDPTRDVVTHTYRIVNVFPHDPQAFTQGLIADGNTLYESTGLNGRSSLREVDLITGNVKRLQPVDPLFFAEGLARIGERLYQLTWQNHVGNVYDRATFDLQRTWQYSGEGWGLAYDGAQLVMSDGTPIIRFLDPQSLAPAREITVTYFGQPQAMLNELEMIDGVLYANIWQTDRIVQIDPRDGRIIGVIDLTGLLGPADRVAPVDVLNGIAYDNAGKRLFVTGKLWPKLFEIELLQAQ